MTGHSLIRVLRIAAPECTPPQAWAGHSTCLETPSASLALATVQLSNDVLQRPCVFPEGSPGVHRGSAHGSHATKIGMKAWQNMREGKGVMFSQQCDDSSGIADKIALMKLPGSPEGDTHGATCALILASHGNDAVFLPHERRPSPAAQSSPNPAASSAEGNSLDALGTRPEAADTETAVDVEAAVERLGSLFGMDAQQSKAAYGKGQQHASAAVSSQAEPGCPTVWVIWAETASLDPSPSLLLGYALLTSRRESALFLRMATGFGFAQLGDYSGSMLYRLGKRGHRFKCWECGVKKKAPCGDTHRADLPWCCHRRLGATLTLLNAAFHQGHVSLEGKEACFVPLLPPKKTTGISSGEALELQLRYRPAPTDVVAFSKLLSQTPVHPAESISTALGRLSPTCRALWSTQWPAQKRRAALAGDEEAAQELHFWLEATAYFKMPKGQEQELIGTQSCSLEKLVAAAVPQVEGAPCLGGHNRAEVPMDIATPEAAAAYLETLSTQPETHRNWTNTGQGRRRLNARAALRQQERSRSPAPSSALGAPNSLGRAASLGTLPEPSGQPSGGPEPADAQPAGRARSAGTLERTRFLPARFTRAKSATYGSDSEDECISPASPEPPSSPNMNDVEMEIAQELNALQRGVPSTTRRRLSSGSPVPKLPASQENNIQPSSVPSSPEYLRPPKRARTSLRSQPGARGSSVRAWQQAGISLRIDSLPAAPRLLVPQVGALGAMIEVRNPLSEVAPHRQRSDSLARDSAAFAKPSAQRKGLEKPHKELSRTLPKTGQAGHCVPSSWKEPCRPDLAEALQRALQQGQPGEALPVLLVSPLELKSLRGHLTLPPSLNRKVLDGQLQVLITNGVSKHQVPDAAFVEGLGRLLSSIRQPKQDATVTIPAATSARAQQAAAVLTPQPISRTMMQQVEKLPVISAGMLQQQFRQLQALQQQGANAAGMLQQGAHTLLAANVAPAAGQAQPQRPTGIIPRAQPGQQQPGDAPHSSASSARRALPQQPGASAAQPQTAQQQRLQMLAGMSQASLGQPVSSSAMRQMPAAAASTPQQPASLTGTQQTAKAAARPAEEAWAPVAQAAKERAEARDVTMERFLRLEQHEQVQRGRATMQAKAARASAQQEGSAGQQRASKGPVPPQSAAMHASARALQQLASSNSSAGVAALLMRVDSALEKAACPAQDARAPVVEAAKKRAEARGVTLERLVQLEQEEQVQELRVDLQAKADQASTQQGCDAGQPKPLPGCMHGHSMTANIAQQHRATAGMAGAAAAALGSKCASAQAPDSAQESWALIVKAAKKRAEARGVTLERLVQLEQEEQVQRVEATMQAEAAIAAAQQAISLLQASQAGRQQQSGPGQAGQLQAPAMGSAPAPEQAPNASAQQRTADKRQVAETATASAGYAIPPWQQSRDTIQREQPAAAFGDLSHSSAGTIGPQSSIGGPGNAEPVGVPSRDPLAAHSACPFRGPAVRMPGMAADVAVTVHLHPASKRVAERGISAEKAQEVRPAPAEFDAPEDAVIRID